MISNLKPYPAMKDSGVEWLGEVPEHWEVRRLKYLLREHDARSVNGKEQLLRVSQFTGVTERKTDDGVDAPDTRAESLVGYKRVNPGELVVNIMLAWNGSMGVSAFSGIASPAYCVYRFGEFALQWYFHNLLRSPVYKARIKAVSTGIVESRLRLYTDDLYRLEGLLPPFPEQTAIVRFLDYVDRRIRRYIGAKEKTGCRGCQFHKGEMFYGTCAVATCCSGKDLLHCGLCPDLPCKALQQAFDHPEHGDNGERLASLRAWAKGGDAYIEIGSFESRTD